MTALFTSPDVTSPDDTSGRRREAEGSGRGVIKRFRREGRVIRAERGGPASVPRRSRHGSCPQRYRGGVSRPGHRDEGEPALASCQTPVSQVARRKQ